MRKHIFVIGGGISGLSALHALRKRYGERDDVVIRLLEQHESPGGTIRSQRTAAGLFESGPNGFLTGYPDTARLIDELELRAAVIEASPSAARRYVSLAGRLHALPMSPAGLLAFRPLSLMDKLRVLGEVWRRPRRGHAETIREFGERRFGRRFTEVILDPAIGGIFAGNIDRLSLRSAFPAIYAYEQEAGSVIRGFLRELRQSRERRRLLSFRDGMGQIIHALAARHRDHIRAGEAAIRISNDRGVYTVSTSRAEYPAHQVFVCVPAYAADPLLRGMAPELSGALARIPYAPVAVIGLAFDRRQLPDRPEGFGFLIPSGERKEVLGVLFEDQIFPGRAGEAQALFRVMIGGARHPECVLRPPEQLTRLALDEITAAMRVEGPSRTTCHAIWPKAIPQYELDHERLLQTIRAECERLPNLYLQGNYLEGISFNDCIRHAAKVVEAAASVI